MVGVAVVGLTIWYIVYLFLAEESSHSRGCSFWVNHMVYEGSAPRAADAARYARPR